MIRRLLCACIGAALVAALAVPARVAAKPPDLPEDGTFTALPASEVLPMPHEVADVTCPYLLQKKAARQVSPCPDAEMGREVLDNLKRLKQADNLLDRAKELARAGFYSEAMECCARAAKLCPGSPCANRADDLLLGLALGFVMPSRDGEEASEPQHDEIVPEKPSSTSNYEFEVGANPNGGLRMCADCSMGGNVYHLRYKDGCLSIWRTQDGGKLKP